MSGRRDLRGLSHQHLTLLLNQGDITISEFLTATKNGVSGYALAGSKISKNFKLAGQRNWVKRRLLGLNSQIQGLSKHELLTYDEKVKLAQSWVIIDELIKKYKSGYNEIYEKNK